MTPANPNKAASIEHVIRRQAGHAGSISVAVPPIGRPRQAPLNPSQPQVEASQGESLMPNEFTTGMPRARVTVPLSAPVTWFDKPITEIVLVEPTARDFFELGEPTMVVHSVGGQGASVVDLNNTMMSYLARCAQVEQADVLITQIGLRDGQALKRALLGFFHPPAETSSA